MRKSQNRENQPKTQGFIDFWFSNTHFRSADAANHLNALRAETRATRRAYLARMCMLDRVIRRLWGASPDFRLAGLSGCIF